MDTGRFIQQHGCQVLSTYQVLCGLKEKHLPKKGKKSRLSLILEIQLSVAEIRA